MYLMVYLAPYSNTTSIYYIIETLWQYVLSIHNSLHRYIPFDCNTLPTFRCSIQVSVNDINMHVMFTKRLTYILSYIRSLRQQFFHELQTSLYLSMLLYMVIFINVIKYISSYFVVFGTLTRSQWIEANASVIVGIPTLKVMEELQYNVTVHLLR